ncbi:MAG: hypothetical protein ACRDJW_09145 [Thermomicrobiales bacterium]
MTRVVYPSARLSANGATALVDTVDDGWRVRDLPSGRVRWDLAQEADLAHVALSASGNAVAWVEERGQVTILTGAGRIRGDLPAPRERIRAIAISDNGDHVAVLRAAGEDGTNGELLLIRREARDEAIAGTELPVYDSGFILANDDCSLLAVRSSSTIDEQQHSEAFVRDEGLLRPLWTKGTAPVSHGALALYGEWLFAATADGLAGWRRTGVQLTVPGSMRERMIFSPDGSHLLASVAEEVIDVTSARMRFRLIDLASLTETRFTSHLIEGRRGAQFVLDTALDLFEVRVTKAGEVAVKMLGWSDGAASIA